MADVDFTTMLCEPELVMITARTVLFAYINLGINNTYLTNFMVLMLCLFGYLFKIECFLLAKDYGKIDKPPSFLLPRIVPKAFDKSRKIPIVYSPLSIALVILSTSSIIASSVDLFSLKPY